MIRLPPFLKYPLRRRRLERPPGFGEVDGAVPPGFGQPPDRAPWTARRRAALTGAFVALMVAPLLLAVAVSRSPWAEKVVADAAFDLLALSFGVVAPSPDPTGDHGDQSRSGPASGTPLTNEEAPRFENSDLDVPEWSSKERVNVILLGTDRRDNEPDVTRTDTILIVSIDPVSKSAGVLSLPRDLWVNIPGYGFERINTAFEIGEYQKKGGGPALLRRTLEGLLGVPMHHYALVGFTGFRKVVDQLGGVVVDVERPFRDDEFPQGNYGTRRILFQAGLQRLDGEQALWYVRSRHADSDFGRNRRQRQFLLAVRQQALQLNMLPKAPAMLASVMDSVTTDLRASEILSLVRVAKDVETSRLTSRAIDETMVNPWMTPGGAAVLLPEPVAIRQVVQEVFGTPGKLPTLPVARPQPVVATPDMAKSTMASDPRTPSPVATSNARPTATTIGGPLPPGYWTTPTRSGSPGPATPTQASLAAFPGTIVSPTPRGSVVGPGQSGVAVVVTPGTPSAVSGTPVSGRAVATNVGVVPVVPALPNVPVVTPTVATGQAPVRTTTSATAPSPTAVNQTGAAGTQSAQATPTGAPAPSATRLPVAPTASPVVATPAQIAPTPAQTQATPTVASR